MGGSSQTTNSQQTVAPYGVQATSLNNLFPAADAAYARSSAVAPYTGDFVQGVSQAGQDAMNAQLGQTSGISQSAIGSLINNGNNSYSNGLGSVGNAIAGLNSFAGQNNTASNISNANAYSNSNIINGQVQSAMNDVNQNYNENIVPGLNIAGAASGNNLSTRQGIAQGIAARGVNEQASNLAGNLTANAYNTGLNLSNSQGQQNLSALSAAGSLGSGLANLGASSLASGVNSNATNTNTLNTINNANIGYGQDNLTNAIDKQNYQVTQPFQSLDLYNNIVNTRNIGSETTGTSTTQQNPSLLSTVGSGLGAVGGLFGKCDATIKTDIKRVGTLDNGLPVYTFRYKDDKSQMLYLGPMAQDVEAIDPSMVCIIDGVKHIKANELFGAL